MANSRRFDKAKAEEKRGGRGHVIFVFVNLSQSIFIVNPKSVPKFPKRPKQVTPTVWFSLSLVNKPWNQTTVSPIGNIPQLFTFTASSFPHSFLNTSPLRLIASKSNTTHVKAPLLDPSLLMAPPARSYPLHGLKFPITVLFIFFLSFLPSKSGKNPPPPSYPI
ncbi:unnamed protein product [Sphenostylis stenocarpa]|uniref:Uncharacterized protein n=1 Tax=Sphenostylis stenocarpa TaxID=92480 RepID=A0AA86SBX4_9FABA|nr:unnamed protein product [Sphenostylis stenocarpa]